MVDSPPSVWRRFFPPLRIGVRLWSTLALLGLYCFVIDVFKPKLDLQLLDWVNDSTVVNSIVLGFLITFRNNTAYDKWWEGRKLWGQLVNDSRNLLIKLNALTAVPEKERRAVGGMVVAFAQELMLHLRQSLHTRPGAPAAGSTTPSHPPLTIASLMYERVGRWRSIGQIDDFAFLAIDPHFKAMMDICGACERIRKTPIAPSYRALLRHGIAIYLVLTPIYVILDAGLWGVPFLLLIAYFLLGLELVAEEVEEPFGAEGDNLRLEQYVQTICDSARQLVGDYELPVGLDHPVSINPADDPIY